MNKEMTKWTAPFILTASLFFWIACATPDKADTSSKIETQPESITTASGLIYEVVEAGSGPVAQQGNNVLIHEKTTLADGTLIVDTWAMNHPIRFLLGGKQAIDGLDEAVTGMKVGERRKLIVPPALSKRSSYPENGIFGPNDTLYYDITLIQIIPE